MRLEMKSLLEGCKQNILALRGRLSSFEAGPRTFRFPENLHALNLRTLAVALSTGISIGHTLDQLEPDNTRTWEQTSSMWATEILQLAKAAIKYRLGSIAMVICLIAAGVGTNDAAIKAEIQALLAEYESSFPRVAATDWTAELKEAERGMTLERPGLALKLSGTLAAWGSNYRGI